MVTLDLSGLHNDVLRFAQRMQEEAERATQVGAEVLASRLREQAQVLPEWSGLADDIYVRSLDGNLVIGMAHRDMASQAFAIEYGDETRPPSPLFRTATNAVAEASAEATEYFIGAMS